MTGASPPDQFGLVRARLRGDAANYAPDCLPPFRRLLDAIEDQDASHLDLCVLVRHALLCQTARSDSAPALWVQAGGRWPNAADWAACGIEAKSRDGGFVVVAEPWRPAWLPDVPPGGVDGAAAGETMRQAEQPVPEGDPFLTEFYPDGYKSRGQRSSLRAALTAPPGSTLIVSLPTGEGKSLIFQAIARFGFGRPSRGTTLVITPTVALALDHEANARRLGFGDGPLAYRAGEAELNTRLCDEIRSGNQTLCFASPEAVCNSPLRSAIEEAAQAGLLRALVVDEAHIIDSWGINFRPDFQVLAALRRNWLARAEPEQAFPTILLSATLTADTIETLRTIFPSQEGAPSGLVSSTRLRPEIDYWVAPDSPDRLTWTEEAILHLPRPAILYTSERKMAQDWHRRLRARGFRRLGLVTGESSSAQRDVVVDGWRAGRIDLVVATSAFGLGIDNPHVRAVVHACVPETLDRFYQEVGRGGRDGHASVSLILPTARDRGIAKSINNERLLSVLKAQPRWQAMFTSNRKEPLGDGLFRLPIDVQPGVDADRIDMVGPTNTGWNVRTLVLVGAMGAVDLMDVNGEVIRDAESQMDDDVDDDAAPPPQSGNARVRSYMTVRIKDMEHLLEEFWTQRVENYRAQRVGVAQNSLGRLTSFLRGEVCGADILAPTYELPEDQAQGRPAVRVAKACGGCPHCRRNAKATYVREPEVTKHPWAPALPDGAVGDLLLNGHLVVSLPDGEISRFERRRAIEALQKLISSGVRNVIALPGAYFSPGDFRGASTPVCFVDHDFVNDLPPGPSLILAGPNARLTAASLTPRDPREGRIWLLPQAVRHPERPDRALCDLPPGRLLTLTMFVGRILS